MMDRRRQSAVVLFVVPAGFRGVFVIEEDPAGGVPPVIEGTSTIYKIPASGKLLTTTIGPLEEWHTPEGRYDNGATLPVEGDPDRIAIRSLWSVDRRVYSLVGTAQEAHEKWALPNRAGLKPGK
jgi:hypothetical protein